MIYGMLSLTGSFINLIDESSISFEFHLYFL